MAGKNSIFDFMDDSPLGDWMAERNAEITSNSYSLEENSYHPNFFWIPMIEEGSVTRFSKAKNFKEYIDWVRQFEKTMIENGRKTLVERIHTLRGIYYGTIWSVDFDVEGNQVRNTMFQLYTNSVTPSDPRPIIGENLYRNLFDSPEVTNSDGELMDFGHLIIGLDARLSMLSTYHPYPGQGGGTGLEICTWVGDIGGGTGMLAQKRIDNPAKRAIEMYKGSSFGGRVNLEGDIAAFLVAQGYLLYIGSNSNDDLIADYLTSYLISDKDKWKNRAKNFLFELGAELDEDKKVVKNVESVKKNISAKLAGFAENYMMLRLWGKPDYIDLMIKGTSHIVGAANEMAEIFVETLTHVWKNQGKSLIPPPNVNPVPTPAGKPFRKYVLAKAAKDNGEEFIREVERYFDKF
jgi:hypothetical protein